MKRLSVWFSIAVLHAGVYAEIHYVDTNSPSPSAPYTNWITAAHHIQSAIDIALDGDEILVADGIYNTGGTAIFGTLTNRVAITKPIIVRSINGPEVTIIEGALATDGGDAHGCGDGAIRCVYVGTNAVLAGFTLTKGHTRSDGVFTNEQHGGGAWCESSAIVSNCIFIANEAGHSGGGMYAGIAKNSIFRDNRVRMWGGGSYKTSVQNCFYYNNSALYGGGAREGSLVNCTVVGNRAEKRGGGTESAYLTNCIVYYNYAVDACDNDLDGRSFSYCCTVPLPKGIGNITNEPGLLSSDDFHLSQTSPCINAGTNAAAVGTDLDGQLRVVNGVTDIGCDEFLLTGLTGSLSVGISANHPTVVEGYPITFSANVDGPAINSRWNFGDGTYEENQCTVQHAYAAAGTYEAVLCASNMDVSIAATTTVHVVAPYTTCVSLSGSETPPYATWATATHVIQDAINVSAIPGGLILITNGTYSGGIVVSNEITVRSLNGPRFTALNGMEITNVIYLSDGAVLAGMRITNGLYGVKCESHHTTVSNCVMEANSSGGAYGGSLYHCILRDNTGQYGGGVRQAVVYNSLIVGNTASGLGGGAYFSYLYNCTVVDNHADDAAGGIWGGGIQNSIIYYNTAVNSSIYSNYNCGNISPSAYICTYPKYGNACITNAPGFVNYISGNFNLASNSPCLDTGTNSLWITEMDLNGDPRVVNGRVDIGAYEYQGWDVDGDRMSDGWELKYFGSLTNATSESDPDHDGLKNWEESVAGTDPVNSCSLLNIMELRCSGTNGFILRWPSVAGKCYAVSYTTNLNEAFIPLVRNCSATPPENSCELQPLSRAYYRIGIE